MIFIHFFLSFLKVFFILIICTVQLVAVYALSGEDVNRNEYEPVGATPVNLNIFNLIIIYIIIIG